MQLFAKKGFLNTTVEDITDAADVGKGTFFNYFPTKEHILAYFAQQQVASIARWARENHESEQSPEYRLHALLSSASKLPGNNPELVRAALGSFFANEDIREDLRRQLAIGRKAIAAYIKGAQQRKQIRSDVSPLLLARTFQQMILGTALMWSVHQDATIMSYLETGFEVVWRGMAPVSSTNTRRTSTRRNGKEQEHGKRS